MLSLRIAYRVPHGCQEGREITVIESVDRDTIACAAALILGEYAHGAQRADDAVIECLVRCTAAQARSMLHAAGLCPERQEGE